jgi:hypothetical protein
MSGHSFVRSTAHRRQPRIVCDPVVHADDMRPVHHGFHTAPPGMRAMVGQIRLSGMWAANSAAAQEGMISVSAKRVPLSVTADTARSWHHHDPRKNRGASCATTRAPNPAEQKNSGAGQSHQLTPLPRGSAFRFFPAAFRLASANPSVATPFGIRQTRRHFGSLRILVW